MFAEALRQCPSAAWTAARDAILPEVHDVDKPALRIWWLFFPLALSDGYESADDVLAVNRRLRIEGEPRLAGQIDSSSWFLYGHRYWPAVKAAIVARAGAGDDPAAAPFDLPGEVRRLAGVVARATGSDVAVTLAAALVGLMTLRQVGWGAFAPCGGSATAVPPGGGAGPAAIAARRRRDDRQGLLRFVRSSNRYTIVFDERSAEARFPILENQHLTTAAALDRRDYTRGPRRFHEGPIPAQCRSATCGTCWIGVLGGEDKLSQIEPHEARRLRAFGYIDPRSPQPVVRLACQARAFGNATIVIPPWNGVIARLYPDGVLPRDDDQEQRLPSGPLPPQ